MQVPDEVFRDAFGAAVLKMPHEDYLRYAAQVVAEWARKEALKEAEEAIDGINSATDLEFYEAGLEAAADAIRDLRSEAA